MEKDKGKEIQMCEDAKSCIGKMRRGGGVCLFKSLREGGVLNLATVLCRGLSSSGDCVGGEQDRLYY